MKPNALGASADQGGPSSEAKSESEKTSCFQCGLTSKRRRLEQKQGQEEGEDERDTNNIWHFRFALELKLNTLDSQAGPGSPRPESGREFKLLARTPRHEQLGGRGAR